MEKMMIEIKLLLDASEKRDPEETAKRLVHTIGAYEKALTEAVFPAKKNEIPFLVCAIEGMMEEIRQRAPIEYHMGKLLKSELDKARL